ncbi:Nucleotide-binding universal stress protein, UspA family [Parasphingorhabdus marina DSM 22363]|uniref:Nucleotide-binding universal stress protein, UspA family n=1 Tax=Parasphingorhabdus marina DSM 22363 TaxID=1123272 RepID=A0A1N6CM80_9SPHN|nr:universal stress protein [Parasphingorhabdus marina]SIN59484.1 Nucleotide-binding universal stress protein, UspA family [Parasphingorhabdus marina DSM 22363]
MAKKILIATDLTARGDRPIDRAHKLARAWNAERTIVFVDAGKKPVEEKQVRKLLDRNYGDDAKECTLVIGKGKAPKVIAETAERLGSDLIVVGAARHNNLSDFFLGTAVNHLVHHASAPVLIVKERPHVNYRSILVATDFSDFSAHALRKALELWPDAQIHLAHAFHVAYEAWLRSDGVAEEMRVDAQKEFDQFMDSLVLDPRDADRITTHLVEGSLHQSIYEMLDGGDVDLLVLGTHGRGGFVHATIGSRASEMLGWSPVDVLMVRKPAGS